MEAVKSIEFQQIAPSLEALCEVTNVNSNAVFQRSFQSKCKAIIMYLTEIMPAIQGFRVFTSLSPHRGKTDLYLGWCLSVEADGTVPEKGKNEKLANAQLKATWAGNWVEGLDLYNLCKTWEQMLVGKEWNAVPIDEWFMNAELITVMELFGFRFFSGINRSGGSVEDRGSFLWVVKTGKGILLKKDSTPNTLPADVISLAQWWFHAALTEAGELFHSEIKVDTDYSKPLQDVFLVDSPHGCMKELATKQEDMSVLGRMTKNVSHTLQALMAENNNVSVSQIDSVASPVFQLRHPMVHIGKSGVKR